MLVGEGALDLGIYRWLGNWGVWAATRYVPPAVFHCPRRFLGGGPDHPQRSHYHSSQSPELWLVGSSSHKPSQEGTCSTTSPGLADHLLQDTSWSTCKSSLPPRSFLSHRHLARSQLRLVSTMSLDPPTYLASLQSNIRQRPIPWDGAVRAGTLTEEHYNKIRAVDKAKKSEERKKIVDADVDGYRLLFVGGSGKPSVLESAAQHANVIQYILVLLSDLLDGECCHYQVQYWDISGKEASHSFLPPAIPTWSPSFPA